jgi:hypothetical protein
LITAAKPKEYIMKFDSGFADAVGQVDRVVNKPSIPNNGAALAAAQTPLRCERCSGAAGLRAADEPARPRPTAERAGTDVVRAQPTATQFAPPNQLDVRWLRRGIEREPDEVAGAGPMSWR